MDKEWGQQGQQVTIAITAPSPNLPHCYISIIQDHELSQQQAVQGTCMQLVVEETMQ
jgi:hypothetical protein